MSNIGGAIQRGNTPFRAVGHTVLFGVDGGLFVSIPNDRLMSAARQKPIVSLADDTVVLDEEASNLKAFARAAGGGHLNNLFEVLVPGGSLRFHVSLPFNNTSILNCVVWIGA